MSPKLEGRRVLFVSPFPAWPLYGGAVVRNHHLLRGLAERNAVWAATRGPALPPPGETPPVQGWVQSAGGSPWELVNPAWWLRLAEIVQGCGIEAIVASSLLVGPQAAALSRLLGVPLLFDAHNAEEARLRRERSPWSAPVGWCERWTVRQARRVTCVSAEDAAHLQAAGARHVQVVPNGFPPGRNGVAERARRRYGLERFRKVVLFYGVLHYGANREAVERLLREPLGDDTVLVVAGVGGERWKSTERVRFLGFVEDLADLLAAADVVAVPVQNGGGTRMKILESVAQGRPVVTTAVGAEGLHRASMGAYLSVAEDPSQFTRLLQTALRDSPGQPVPGEFHHRYCWNEILKRGLDW